MWFGAVGQAAGMFAVTNVDDLVLLALWFGQARDRGGAARIVAGQYLGFTAIVAIAVVGALGVGLLPDAVAPYLGLAPLALGIKAAWSAWRADTCDDPQPAAGPGVLAVAAVTLANGGDNIGVYVPVFAVVGTDTLVVYVIVFLVLVGVWCAAGRFLATRAPVARALSRWGHVVLPVVLICIGALILIDGGAFGL